MASLQKEKSGTFHIVVRIDGKRFKRSLETKSVSVASSKKEDIEETLSLIKRGKIQMQEELPLIDFLLGKKKNPIKLKSQPSPKAHLTIKSFFEMFFASIPKGSNEKSTLDQMHTHKRHFLRILGEKSLVQKIDGQVLQSYVNSRSSEHTHFLCSNSPKDESRRTPVTGATIKKEIVTLGTVWRWAQASKLVDEPFPNRGLRYPKVDEKPHFQTWDEIERQIKGGFLSLSESDLLWSCLYLRNGEIAELLKYVKENSNFPFVYPMFSVAAYTGARRSELLRSKPSDFDFENGIITIRERKRVKGKRSYRRVPISNKLRPIISAWFETREGGPTTFLNHEKPISRDQAHSHFKQTLSGSRWEKVKGWHCLRHSFISNLACAGIDQRIIDEFVGHTSEEMRRRYRHLFPDVKEAAINQVFG